MCRGKKGSTHCKVIIFLQEGLAWIIIKFRIQKRVSLDSSMQALTWGDCICVLCHFNAMGNWFNFVNRLML